MSRRKTKSRKQIRQDAQDEKASKKFLFISVAITVVLLILMYFTYNGF